MNTNKLSAKKLNIIMMLFPIAVMVIFSVICYISKNWLFAAFNVICVGLFFLYAAVLQETLSKKVCAIICALLMILNGALINIILPIQTTVVDANIEDCVEYKIDENKKEYKLLLSYEVDGNKYYNFDVSVKKALQPNQQYTVMINKNNPEDLLFLDILTGRLVGVVYIVIGVAIIALQIYFLIKKRGKKTIDKSEAIEADWEDVKE